MRHWKAIIKEPCIPRAQRLGGVERGCMKEARKRSPGCMAWGTGEKPRGNKAGQTDGFWVLKEVWNILGRWRAWSLGSLGGVWVSADPRKPLLHAEDAQSWHDSRSYRSDDQVAGFETTPGNLMESGCRPG